MAKILVVDDERSVREMLQMFLESAGHSIAQAETGMEGLAKLRDGAFELLILDVGMPGLSGLAMLRLLRREARFAKLPVLMCTANGKMADLDSAFEAGANGYIIKPFDAASLNQAVSNGLACMGKPPQKSA